MDDLAAMFHKEIVDGSNAYVPGQDFYDEGGQDEEEDDNDDEEEEEPCEEEEFVHTPRSTSSRKSKRSGGSNMSTGNSPQKKNKSQGKRKVKNQIVKVLNKIATTYSQSVSTNQQTIKEHKDSKLEAEKKMDAEIEECQQLAWGCVPHDSVEAYATFKIFKSKFNRRYFLTIPTVEGRRNFLQRWCKDNNMY